MPSGTGIKATADHEAQDELAGKVVKSVVWIMTGGGAPSLKITFTDGSVLDIDHEGDDASGLVTEYRHGSKQILS